MISKEENILLNAEKLFSEKGFNGTSTREISKAACVNISMISYYFGSKENLFIKIFEYRMNQGITFSKDVLANKNINAWEKFALIIDQYTERMRTLKDFYVILQREQLLNQNPEITDFLKNSKKSFLETYQILISEGMDEKIFTKNPELEFMHSTISGTMFMAFNTFSTYKEFFSGGENYDKHYYEKLKIHIKNILKYLLGYEENK